MTRKSMTTEIEQTWSAALPFHAYRRQLKVHAQTFNEHYERLAFVSNAEAANAPLPPIRILVLTEEWCPDSVLNVPLVARLAEASGAEVRIADLNQHRRVASRFPGRGGVSRRPTVIFLRDPGEVLGHWSERSQRDHRWMAEFTEEDPLPPLEFSDGQPSPSLAAWMERRFAAQRPVYEAEGWQDVRDELRSVVSATEA